MPMTCSGLGNYERRRATLGHTCATLFYLFTAGMGRGGGKDMEKDLLEVTSQTEAGPR